MGKIILKDRDVQIFDAEIFVDKLWSKECFNDIFENGFNNDQFALLYNVNKTAQVAVKTHGGITQRISISDTIMQGTVWGSLLCTSTVDSVGRKCYGHKENFYTYKEVPIPLLGRVDDIISVTNVNQTENMKNLINTFIKSKNLKLSHTKCFQIILLKDTEPVPNSRCTIMTRRKLILKSI